MSKSPSRPKIEILVQQVAVRGMGAILLTGPSSCGKGEIANALCRFLSLPARHHISMGDVLRQTIRAAKEKPATRKMLREQCGINDRISVLDLQHNPPARIAKVKRYIASDTSLNEEKLSQFDWLDYCVHTGLLVPDAWTECLIETRFRNTSSLRDSIFILDGYPRTPNAAESLLDLFLDLDIGIIKVLHLSITKSEMISRAHARGRADDTDEALNRRYDFYVDHVQPCIDYMKSRLGTQRIALIDAHQPVYNPATGEMDLAKSIRAVTASVLEALGLPRYLLDLDGNDHK